MEQDKFLYRPFKKGRVLKASTLLVELVCGHLQAYFSDKSVFAGVSFGDYAELPLTSW